MATFSTNQVRQFYVATALKASHAHLADSDTTEGLIAIPFSAATKKFYIEQIGKGGKVRTDLIDVANIRSAKGVNASQMAHALKRVKVTLNSSINSGAPISGQDYILRLAFRQFVGLSDEDQYFKYGEVRGTVGMTASAFYIAMAKSIASNMKNDVVPLVKIYAYNSTDSTLDPVESISASDTYTYLIIEEAAQPWKLGVFAQAPTQFTVQDVNIVASGQSTKWATIEDAAAATTLTNGKLVADLEYFCMGERADIYRNVGFPNVIPASLMVDPSKVYDLIDIEYFWAGGAEDVQKSPKTITIAVPQGAAGSVHTVANNIIDAIELATGLTIPAITD